MIAPAAVPVDQPLVRGDIAKPRFRHTTKQHDVCLSRCTIQRVLVRAWWYERDNGKDNRVGTEIMQAERIARKTRLRVHRIVIPRLSP